MVNTGIRMNNIGEYLTAFVIDVENEEMGPRDVANTLKDLKREIKTECIDVDEIVVDGMHFKAIFGANAKNNAHTSCVDKDGKVVYKGNVVVFGTNKDSHGNESFRSLTDAEMELLMCNTGLMTIDATGNGGQLYNAYVLCNVKIAE